MCECHFPGHIGRWLTLCLSARLMPLSHQWQGWVDKLLPSWLFYPLLWFLLSHMGSYPPYHLLHSELGCTPGWPQPNQEVRIKDRHHPHHVLQHVHLWCLYPVFLTLADLWWVQRLARLAIMSSQVHCWPRWVVSFRLELPSDGK